MRTKLLFACLVLSLTIGAQVPDWQWAKSAGKVSFHEYSKSICTDKDGNSYITGTFQDTIYFGSYRFINDGSFGERMFIAKYNSSGQAVWALAPFGNGGSSGDGITIDSDGNFYVTGYIRGVCIFGQDTLTNPGGWKTACTLKFGPNGLIKWGRTSSSYNHENYGSRIAVSKDGEVYSAGLYDSSVTFDQVTLYGSFLFNQIYLLKYDSTGTLLWGKTSGGGNNVGIGDLVIESGSHVYMTGNYRYELIFDSDTLNGTSNGTACVFTVKFEDTGSPVWMAGSGGFPSSGYGEGLGLDASENVYVTGYYNSAVMIFGTDTLPNAGANDLFIIKYDSAGFQQWVHNAGGTDFDQGSAMITDEAGNSYMTGFFKGLISFGTTTLFGPNQELFVTKYDNAGNVAWAVSATGDRNDRGSEISRDSVGNIYVTGAFSSTTTTFGTHQITNTDPFTGSYDLYVAKLGTAPVGVEEISSSASISLFPNPFSEKATIVINKNGNEQVSLYFYDVTGKTVWMIGNVKGNTVEIDRSIFTSGLYLCRLIGGANNSTVKFIVE